jgi:ORF6N domain
MEVAIIENKMYEIRGHKVMLDFDLAALYETETKYLKRAVKQNIKKNPTDFMFEITKVEFESLRCSFNTSKRGGTRYMPFAFTKHGVTMLASILNFDRAVELNIAVVRTFISIRNYINKHKKLSE